MPAMWILYSFSLEAVKALGLLSPGATIGLSPGATIGLSPGATIGLSPGATIGHGLGILIGIPERDLVAPYLEYPTPFGAVILAADMGGGNFEAGDGDHIAVRDPELMLMFENL